MSDLPYSDMIKQRLVEKIEKIEISPTFTYDFAAGIRFMKEEVLKVIKERE